MQDMYHLNGSEHDDEMLEGAELQSVLQSQHLQILA
jgi:hypothetical protein